MALLKKDKADPVGAARKALEDAEAAATAATKRATEAAEKAVAFERRAAEIDPDSDEGAFSKATRELAELRATADLLRARTNAAATRAEQAREAHAGAVNADRLARLEELNAGIKAREGTALEALRVAFAAFAAEVSELGAASSKAHTLQAELRSAGIEARAIRAMTASWAGANPCRIAALAAENMRF
jgi:hypothetical protein